MKTNTRIFEPRLRNELLEVWLPPVEAPRGRASSGNQLSVCCSADCYTAELHQKKQSKTQRRVEARLRAVASDDLFGGAAH